MTFSRSSAPTGCTTGRKPETPKRARHSEPQGAWGMERAVQLSWHHLGQPGQLPGFPPPSFAWVKACPYRSCATSRSGDGGKLLGVGESLGGKTQSPQRHVEPLYRLKSKVLAASRQLSNCELRASGVSGPCSRRNSALCPASSTASSAATAAANSAMLFRAVLLCAALALSHAGE